MYDHAVIQINDTHPTMVIPELIRILVEEKAFTIDEAIEVVSKTCAYTNHTILAEALEKWPLKYLEKVVPQLVPYIKELDNGKYMVHCEIAERGRKVLDINVEVDSKLEADRMVRNFNRRPEIVYRGTLALVSGETNYIFE